MIKIKWEYEGKEYSEDYWNLPLLPVGTIISVYKYDINFDLRVNDISAIIERDSSEIHINCSIIYHY